MDVPNLESVARSLNTTITRRNGLLGMLLGLFGATTISDSLGKKKKKKKKKSPPDCTVCAEGCPYSTIEAAIAAAQPNDTITIYKGTYHPVNSNPTDNYTIKIDKSITINRCFLEPDQSPVIVADPVALGANHESLFWIENSDETLTCRDDQISVSFYGLAFEGTPDRAFVETNCKLQLRFDNTEISKFSYGTSPISLRHTGTVVFDDFCDIHDNVSETRSVIDFEPPAYDQSHTLSLVNTVVHDNTSSYRNTGAVGVNNGHLYVYEDTRIHGNDGGYSPGAGIMLGSEGHVLLEADTRIYANTSSQGSGVLATYADSITMEENTTLANYVYNNTGGTCNNVFAQGQCLLS